MAVEAADEVVAMEAAAVDIELSAVADYSVSSTLSK